MKDKGFKPKTLQAAIQHFSDEQTCIDAVALARWPDGKPVCPKCQGREHYYLASQRRWKCKNGKCGKQFSVKVGTIFEDSPLGLDKWLSAMWMLANCKNGISSWELHRTLGITQKSAWFMLHRIRLSMQSGSIEKMGGSGGEVEVDETFIGGKLKNMHSRKRNKIVRETGTSAGALNKTVVVGILDRKLRSIRTKVVPNTSRITLQNEVLTNVHHGTNVYTDELRSYSKLNQNYVHEVVNHAEQYVRGRVHTNGLENFWSLLKRNLAGTYVAVEPFHLFRYLDEQSFRYNSRGEKRKPVTDAERFEMLLSQVAGRRLTYESLTGKEGGTSAF